MALQRNFNRAEDSADLLRELLKFGEGSVESAVADTYEGHAVELLRTQLFRLLIVDLHAGLWDDSGNSGSLLKLLRDLEKPHALPALTAYYANPAAFSVEIGGLDDATKRAAREKAEIAQAVDTTRRLIAGHWAEVRSQMSILTNVEAERLKWARHHAIAHFKKTLGGLMSITDMPPYGSGALTLDEPILFLDRVREFVYRVFYLVTNNVWYQGDVASMYARAFWDRFKNGRTVVEPDASTRRGE